MRDRIRNFAIISHVDHGKSTLADRLLEFTGTIEKRKMKEQILDSMELERERGITIKLTPARMIYQARTNADDTRTNADDKLLYEDLTYKIRGAAFQVRKKIGLGHKEIVYQKALEEEFKASQLNFEKEKVINIVYEGKKIGIYRPDFVVEDKIIVEIKALPFIGANEEKQIWTYLKGSDYKLLLLINFSPKDIFIKRIIYDTVRNGQRESASSPRESAFILNLIDTPGHVDFTYEVSRSLAAVEGALLLVDATQGVQAQTLGNLYLALEQNLAIIPVVNKIDLPNADIKKTKEEIVKLVGCREDEILLTSGKTGQGVESVLEAITRRIPEPKGTKDAEPRALIFDSKYDEYRGVVAYVRLVDGSLKKGDKIKFFATGAETEILEIGYFSPDFVAQKELCAGEIGYIVTALKNIEGCRVGDTIIHSGANGIKPLEGYKEVKPMVFAGFYPKEGQNVEKLREAMGKLKLNDAAMSYEPERNAVLGFGFRVGFLGLLHLEITKERLKREYGIDLIVTVPSVAYKVFVKGKKEPIIIKSAAELPDPVVIEHIEDPQVLADIIAPKEYLGQIMKICEERRGEYKNTEYLGGENPRVILHYNLPLSVILVDFYDKLKSASQGYASLNYEITGFKPNDIVKLSVLINGDAVEELSTLVYRDESYRRAREIAAALKKAIPRQMIEVKIQVAIGGKIVAAERIAPFRKDVLAKLYGGDVTRKMKLLKKQKEGKKKMLGKGQVNIPTDAYLSVLKRE
jgi:GTP-binding protein LepA